MTHDAIGVVTLESLGNAFTHEGQLFRPTVEFYNSLHTDTGLQAAYRSLYAWLGTKPRQLRIAFATIEETYIVHKDGHLTLSAKFQTHPYQAGALLALAVMEQLLTTRHHYKIDSNSILSASIWAGLGALVMNGFVAPGNKLVKLHHNLDGDWHISDGLMLSAKTKTTYTQQLISYIHSYHIKPEDALSSLTSRAQKRIDFGYYTPRARHTASPEYIHKHYRRAYARLFSVFLYGVIASALVLLALFIIAQQ